MIPVPSRRWLTAAAGLSLVALTGLVWQDALTALLLLDAAWVAAFALDAALGRNIFGLLPQGSGRINWRSAITEVQMLLGKP